MEEHSLIQTIFDSENTGLELYYCLDFNFLLFVLLLNKDFKYQLAVSKNWRDFGVKQLSKKLDCLNKDSSVLSTFFLQTLPGCRKFLWLEKLVFVPAPVRKTSG